MFCILLLTSITANGQIGDSRFGGSGGSEPIIDDTTSYPALSHTFVYSNRLDDVHTFLDTAFDYRFQFVDPSRKTYDEAIHLGYLGSSSFPLSYEPQVYRGFNTGYHQYDLYKLRPDAMKFYLSNRTVADLSFFQTSGNQNNFNANADYFQQFKDDISVSINYKRFNYEGIYSDQDNQSTAFGIGLLYRPRGKSFKGFLSFINNNNNESFNGGYLKLNDLTGPLSTFRQNVPVALEGTRNRHADRKVNIYFEKNILGEKVKAENLLSYGWNNYLYYDTGVLDQSDSVIYQSYIVDKRGLRSNMQTSVLSNSFSLTSQVTKTIYLKAGLAYDLIKIRAPYNRVRNDLSIVYEGDINLKKKFKLKVDGHFGIGDNAGNLLLRGGTEIQIGKYLNVDAKWTNYITEPGYIYNQFILNEQQLYDNKFNKLIGSRLEGALKLKTLGLQFGFDQNLVNNAIYWDEDSLPIQASSVYSSTRLLGVSKIRLWIIGFENTGVYQLFSNNLYNQPDWYTTHDINLNLKLFKKKLTLKVGSNLRLIPSGQAQSFNPVIGQFYKGADINVLYPEWNWYINAKVSRFRLLVQYDNIAYWMTNSINENINKHPYLDANLKFGIRWMLLD